MLSSDQFSLWRDNAFLPEHAGKAPHLMLLLTSPWGNHCKTVGARALSEHWPVLFCPRSTLSRVVCWAAFQTGSYTWTAPSPTWLKSNGKRVQSSPLLPSPSAAVPQQGTSPRDAFAPVQLHLHQRSFDTPVLCLGSIAFVSPHRPASLRRGYRLPRALKIWKR